MKRYFALFFLLLFGCRTGFAFHHDVGQFYDGEARPRAEVAWIWVGPNVFITRIDNDRLAIPPSRIELISMKAAEVLPGKHIVTLRYLDMAVGVESNEDTNVQIDAAAGQNYLITGKAKVGWKHGNSKWEDTITTFSPIEKDIESLKRVKLERWVSVDSVVQSWEIRHRNLVLALPGGAPAREFKCNFNLQVGQKIRVFFFPSWPAEAMDVTSLN
jgi:hypothetical protein